MSQKIINIGTVANDGTGDTIRGAFTNVNANFTEVYNNVAVLTAGLASIDTGQNVAISSSYTTANIAFNIANAGFDLANNVSINANLYSIAIGAASNTYANLVGSSANAVSNVIGNSANAYMLSVAVAGNAYSVSVGAASNSWTNGALAWANTLALAGNNYASTLYANNVALAANNATGANNWANTVSITITDWANSKFDTIVNTAAIINLANAAYIRANNSLANTANASNGSITLIGSLTTTGFLNDAIGPVREKSSNNINSNYTVRSTQSIIIANNANAISIKIPDDTTFFLTSNIGSKIEIYQLGSGNTTVLANDAAVNIYSSNNWSNIAGQYLTATATKVLPNTWILTGNLKA